jgi:hypothetical protein
MSNNHSFLWMRFRPFPCLLEKIINYSLNWNRKNNLLSLDNSSVSRPLSSVRLGGYYRPQKLYLFRHKTKSVKVFSLAIHVHSTWISYHTDGCDPICVLNKSRVSLYARAYFSSNIHFSI